MNRELPDPNVARTGHRSGRRTRGHPWCASWRRSVPSPGGWELLDGLGGRRRSAESSFSGRGLTLVQGRV